jgi:hypothetical protein
MEPETFYLVDYVLLIFGIGFSVENVLPSIESYFSIKPILFLIHSIKYSLMFILLFRKPNFPVFL